MTKETTVQVRLTREQLELWKQAAYLRRVSLSEWMRLVLTANAENVIAKEKS